jgi:hypothetical protein
MYDLIISCLLFHVATATTLIFVYAISEIGSPTRTHAPAWRDVTEDLSLALLNTRTARRADAASAKAEAACFQSRAA